MLQHSNTPLSWNSLKKRIKIAVMVVSRCLPAQWNSCIHFHIQGITAHTDLRLGTKRKWALLYLLSFAGLTLPPREINAYVFTNRANGRHAYLFYIYLQCSQELKISPEMKAYVGIKSRSCSSLPANNAFRTSLAGVCISVAFLRYKEEVGRAGKEEMSAGRQRKAATNTAFGSRGQEDARYSKAAVCPGNEQIKDIKHLLHWCSDSWSWMVHTDASTAFHHSFCLSTEHIQASIGTSHSIQGSDLPQVNEFFIHSSTSLSWNLVPISGLGMSSWGSDPGSKVLFLSPHHTTLPTSIDSILTH